ncbi:hypothetical protein ACIOWI_29660 [Streptomyces sp. NPDC087659]|uniref:hypothetical protein n=1 Tax=Streptomyces sp. NPDC087659 TaxID=3365801 RepID=UPI0038169AAB
MALGFAHTLFCDRPGCRSQLTITGTRSAAHARAVAHGQHGWRTRAQDLCPNEPAPARASDTVEVRR